MSHTIELRDDLYEQLAERAAERGQTVDALVESCLLFGLPHLSAPQPAPEFVYDPAKDPILPFIGAFDSGDDDPGWVERHDEYFAGRLEPGDDRDDVQ